MPTGVFVRTKEYRDNMAKKMSGNTNGFQKGKVSSWKGKHHSLKSKQKLSKALKGDKRLGHKTKLLWQNPEYRKHMEEAHKGCNKGSKSHLWRGGIERVYSIDWTQSLRRSIRERDRYICQLCSEQQGEEAFSVHHIDYDKENCNPNNLITLCRSCHTKTNSKRKYWKQYFTA